jgi:hypothetical protein
LFAGRAKISPAANRRKRAFSQSCNEVCDDSERTAQAEQPLHTGWAQPGD